MIIPDVRLFDIKASIAVEATDTRFETVHIGFVAHRRGFALPNGLVTVKLTTNLQQIASKCFTPRGWASSPSEDYLTVLAGQRQWIATTNLPVAPAGPQILARKYRTASMANAVPSSRQPTEAMVDSNGLSPPPGRHASTSGANSVSVCGVLTILTNRCVAQGQRGFVSPGRRNPQSENTTRYGGGW